MPQLSGGAKLVLMFEGTADDDNETNGIVGRPRWFSRPRARQLIAGPALVVVVIVATTTVWFSAQPPHAEEAGGVARFVPADGAIVAERLAPVDGKPVERVTQHARIAGYAIASEIPTAFSSALDVLVTDNVDLSHATYWIRSTEQFSDSHRTSGSHGVSVLTGAGISDLLLYGGNFSLIFNPPVLQLPASPAVGVTWHQDGDALPGSILHYTQRGSVLAVPDAARAAAGCVAAHTLMTLSQPAGSAALLTVDDLATWCPGVGVVSEVGTITGTQTDTIPGSTPVGLGQLELTSQPLTTSSPPTPAIGVDATLGPAAVKLVFDDVTFGKSQIHGQTALRPVELGGGRLVVVESTTNDVVMLTMTTDGELKETWRQHPGGVVLSVASVAGVIVTTTAARTVTAYTPDGAPRWTRTIDDASVSGATAAGDVIVVGTLSGTVYGFKAGSGSQEWRRTLPDSILTPPVSTTELAVVAAADGELVAYTPTGATAWSATVAGLGSIAASSKIVAVAAQGAIRQFDAANGTLLASSPFQATSPSIRIDHRQLIAFNDAEMISIAPGANNVLWSSGGGRDAVLTDAGVVVRTADRVEFLSHSTGVSQAWRYDKTKYTDPRFASAPDWCVPFDGSVLLVDTNLLAVLLAGAKS